VLVVAVAKPLGCVEIRLFGVRHLVEDTDDDIVGAAGMESIAFGGSVLATDFVKAQLEFRQPGDGYGLQPAPGSAGTMLAPSEL
jgi:hypothetical protein